MIYGSSYSSSSSSSRAGFFSESPTPAEDIDDERRSLLRHENPTFWSPRESKAPASFKTGAAFKFRELDISRAETIPASQRFHEPDSKMVRFRGLLQKLETDHEAGVSNAQLMLINHDLKPGMDGLFARFLLLSCAAFGS